MPVDKAPPPDLDPVRERIVSAARGHFFQHGFRGVTMDDLAAEMGMSKKTLYVRFPSKRQLLEAVVEQKISGFERSMDAIETGSPANFPATLHRLLSCLQEQAQELTPTFVRDLAREDPALIATVKRRRRALISRTFGRLLAVGQEAGAIRRDLSPEFLVEILLSLADSIATPESVTAQGITPSEALSAILSVFLHGVTLAPTGAPV